MSDETTNRPDSAQIIMGNDLLTAFREVGVLPADLYTTEGVTLEIQRNLNVVARIGVVVPLDRLQRAIELIAQKRGEAQPETDYAGWSRSYRETPAFHKG